MPEKYKILITGSCGMLGADLVDELDGEYSVYGIDLAQSTGPGSEKYFKADITDRENLRNAIKRVSPGIVIHAAAWTDVDGCELDKDKAYKVNSEAAASVASVCKETGAALCYISTDFVFDGKKSAPYKEKDRPHPLSVYGSSKLKGEKAVARQLKNYFVLRTSWLYGRNGRNFVDTIIEKARCEKVLKVVDDQVGSPTYTKDLAKAIRAMLGKATTGYGVYHVSNSGSVSWYEYAREILRLSGAEAEVVPVSSQELKRPARRPAMSALDNTKFNNFTNYTLRSWKDALEEYLS